jgi:Domain of unknown function (DUF5680)
VDEGFDIPGLAKFLAEAKRRTYAGLNDDATMTNPLLQGSMQLEWRQGDWHYRDIYFGMSAFSGIEVVSLAKQPVWVMTYSGGGVSAMEPIAVRRIYAFLRSALLRVSPDLPLRGPSHFAGQDFLYHMNAKGDLGRFSGVEEIRQNGSAVYSLNFAGGLIK